MNSQITYVISCYDAITVVVVYFVVSVWCHTTGQTVMSLAADVQWPLPECSIHFKIFPARSSIIQMHRDVWSYTITLPSDYIPLVSTHNTVLKKGIPTNISLRCIFAFKRIRSCQGHVQSIVAVRHAIPSQKVQQLLVHSSINTWQLLKYHTGYLYSEYRPWHFGSWYECAMNCGTIIMQWLPNRKIHLVRESFVSIKFRNECV